MHLDVADIRENDLKRLLKIVGEEKDQTLIIAAANILKRVANKNIQLFKNFKDDLLHLLNSQYEEIISAAMFCLTLYVNKFDDKDIRNVLRKKIIEIFEKSDDPYIIGEALFSIGEIGSVNDIKYIEKYLNDKREIHIFLPKKGFVIIELKYLAREAINKIYDRYKNFRPKEKR